VCSSRVGTRIDPRGFGTELDGDAEVEFEGRLGEEEFGGWEVVKRALVEFFDGAVRAAGLRGGAACAAGIASTVTVALTRSEALEQSCAESLGPPWGLFLLQHLELIVVCGVVARHAAVPGECIRRIGDAMAAAAARRRDEAAEGKSGTRWACWVCVVCWSGGCREGERGIGVVHVCHERGMPIAEGGFGDGCSLEIVVGDDECISCWVR
jgi:hypothetical protein